MFKCVPEHLENGDWLEMFTPDKCKFKAQGKLMYGFQYENQIN